MLMGEEVVIPTPWGHIAGKEWGTVGGDPVLCLHGYNDNAAVYDTLLSLMIDTGHYYLAIDLPGHGRSAHYPSNSQLSNLEFLADMKRICLHFGWEKITILAHSLFTRLAIYFAAVYPRLVKMIILFDMAPGTVLCESAHICDMVLHEVEALVRNANKKFHHESGYTEDESFKIFLESRPATVQNKDALHSIFLRSTNRIDEKVYFSTDKRNKSLIAPLTTSQFHKSLLSNISCPILMISSKQSISIFEEYDQWYDLIDGIKRSLKNKLTIFEIDSSHEMLVENSENIAPIISAYMKLRNKL